MIMMEVLNVELMVSGIVVVVVHKLELVVHIFVVVVHMIELVDHMIVVVVQMMDHDHENDELMVHG